MTRFPIERTCLALRPHSRYGISASSDARDRNSPMSSHQISLSTSHIRQFIARFAAIGQAARDPGENTVGSAGQMINAFVWQRQRIPRAAFDTWRKAAVA